MWDLLCSISFPGFLTRGAGLCLAAHECQGGQGGPGQGETAVTCPLCPRLLPQYFTHQLPQNLGDGLRFSVLLMSCTSGHSSNWGDRERRKERTRRQGGGDQSAKGRRGRNSGPGHPAQLGSAVRTARTQPHCTFPPHQPPQSSSRIALCARQGRQAPAEQSGPQSLGCSGRSQSKVTARSI